MSSIECKYCGQTEVEIDTSQGATVCISCGSVLEESAIVSEVQFEENAHGVSSAIGQFVSADSSGGNFRRIGNIFYTPSTKENREANLHRVKRAMAFIGKQLKIDSHIVDEAVNFYRLALYRHLTRGRRSFLTYAGCLYSACRLERTPHLLIDFCDLLQLNVFSLSHVCSVMCKGLDIVFPYTDPCVYLLRYANQLNFEKKTHDVYTTALRILKRMKRDSLHHGRIPAGLCGAALLLSARYHQFNRSLKDIVSVVRIHETTLKKRLQEFGDTPSGGLTVDKFFQVDLDEEQDPPSFREARLRDIKHIDESSEEYQRKLRLLELIIEKQLDSARTKRKTVDDHIEDILSGAYASADKDGREYNDDSDGNNDDDYSDGNRAARRGRPQKRSPAAGKGSSNAKKKGKRKLTPNLLKDMLQYGVGDEETTALILESTIETVQSYIGGESGKDSDDDFSPSKKHRRDNEYADEWQPPPNDADIGLPASLETLGLGQKDHQCEMPYYDGDGTEIHAADMEVIVNDEELKLLDLEMYFVKPEEQETKMKIWNETFRTYLHQQEQKRLKEAKSQEDSEKRGVTKRKSRKKDNAGPSGPTETLARVLKAKKVSKKINYDVLKTLNFPDFPEWEAKNMRKAARPRGGDQQPSKDGSDDTAVAGDSFLAPNTPPYESQTPFTANIIPQLSESSETEETTIRPKSINKSAAGPRKRLGSSELSSVSVDCGKNQRCNRLFSQLSSFSTTSECDNEPPHVAENKRFSFSGVAVASANKKSRVHLSSRSSVASSSTEECTSALLAKIEEIRALGQKNEQSDVEESFEDAMKELDKRVANGLFDKINGKRAATSAEDAHDKCLSIAEIMNSARSKFSEGEVPSDFDNEF